MMSELVQHRLAAMARGLGWEQFDGLSVRTGARTITEADIVAFITAAGFTESLFLDARAAAELGYAGRLVPGALTWSYSEGLVVQSGILKETGLALLGVQLSIKKPVFTGDTISVVVEGVSVKAASRGRGIVETRHSVRNQDDVEVLVYNPIRLIAPSDPNDME